MRALPSFDELLEIKEHSEADLESLRQALIRDLIDQAPDHIQRRLEGLQFQIDMERRRCANPMAACIKISGMMHDSLGKLTSLLRPESLERYGSEALDRGSAATVISLQPLRSQQRR